MIVRAIGITALLLLSGCTLFDRQEKRVNYTEDLNDVEVLVTDAKQRQVFVAPKVITQQQPAEAGGDNAGMNASRNVICAEPSPDVAQAISAAFTAAAQVDAKTSGAPAAGAAVGANQQFAGSGSLGSSYAASIAQLGERLATVQLLRDKMYRACEGYQNGAITDTSYTLMLARFDKTMASMLASEVAGGAFGRGLAALGGSAATGGVDPAKLKAAQSDVQSAAQNLKEASAATDDKRADKVKAAGEALDAAVGKLVALELQAMQSAAASGLAAGASLGQINGRTGAGDPSGVVAINRLFIDDDASSGILEACIVALDRKRSSFASKEAQAAFEKNVFAKSEVQERLTNSQSRLVAGVEQQILRDGTVQTKTLTDNEKRAIEGEVFRAQKELELLNQQAEDLRLLQGPSLAKTCDKILGGSEGGSIVDRLQRFKLDLRTIEGNEAAAENRWKTNDTELRKFAATTCNERFAFEKEALKWQEAFQKCFNGIVYSPKP